MALRSEPDLKSDAQKVEADRPATPMPVESLKVQVDYAKWLATICTAAIGASGPLLSAKVSGIWSIAFAIAVGAFIVCLAKCATIILSLAHLIGAYELGKADASHAKTTSILYSSLKSQGYLFFIGLVAFAAAYVGPVLCPLEQPSPPVTNAPPAHTAGTSVNGGPSDSHNAQSSMRNEGGIAINSPGQTTQTTRH